MISLDWTATNMIQLILPTVVLCLILILGYVKSLRGFFHDMASQRNMCLRGGISVYIFCEEWFLILCSSEMLY